MRCSRCNRTLRRDPVYFWGNAYGRRCAAIIGLKPGRASRKAAEDDRQAELFVAEARP